MTRLSILLLALFAAGCASFTEPLGMKDPFALSQPFQGAEQNLQMLGSIAEIPAVVVKPVEGLSPTRGEAVRDRVMQVLREHEVPAIAQSATSIVWTLQGQAAFITRQNEKGGADVTGTIAWQLIDPTGKDRAHFVVALAGVEETLTPPVIKTIAEETAVQLDASLARPRTQVVEAPAVKAALPTATIAWVKGAPGDGNAALTKALTGLLPLKGVDIATKDSPEPWRIEGTINVVPKREQDVVTLSWRVLDYRGREAGTITQENAVPHKRLDTKWGEIAGYAAEAAAEGIAQLIHSFTRKPAPQAAATATPAAAN